MDGVSVTFFCAAIRCLDKLHGSRNCSGAIEDFRAALQLAEEIFKSLPVAEPRKRKVKR